MAVLVVGGAGYVGQFLIKALLEQGAAVHVTHREGRDVSQLPSAVRCHAVDYTDSEAMLALLREVHPQVVVNAAAMSALGACEKDPEGAERANCPQDLVNAIATEASGAPRLFIHFSTDIVFGGDPEQVYDEDSAPAPVNSYGRLKAKFDSFLAECKEPFCVVLRPTNIVGPRHPYMSTGTKFLQWLDNQLRQDAPTKVFNDEFRNYVWVGDLVAVVLKLIVDFPASPPPSRLLHCGGPDALSRVDVANMLAAAKGYSMTYEGAEGAALPRVVPTPRADVDLGYASPLCVRMASGRAEGLLGRPFRRLVDCLREHTNEI